MDVLSFAELREDLQAVMDKVVSDHAPLVVAREGAEAVVLVSLADWNAMEETARLLQSPGNARRLQAAIAELSAGTRATHESAEG